jgi:hypothetical protein
MAKKNKKQMRKVPAAAAASTISSTASNSASARPYESSFQPDYSETIKDLKRIGLLAGTFFTVLVILSFFLR